MFREDKQLVENMIVDAIAEMRSIVKELSERVEKLEKAMTTKKPAKGVDDAKL